MIIISNQFMKGDLGKSALYNKVVKMSQIFVC